MAIDWKSLLGNIVSTGASIYGASKNADAAANAATATQKLPLNVNSNVLGTTAFDPATRNYGVNSTGPSTSPYAGASPELIAALEGVNNTDAATADRLAALRSLSAPQEQQATNKLTDTLFSRGQLGGTGGALQQEALFRAQAQADQQRQLTAADWAQNRAITKFNSALSTVGQGQAAQAQEADKAATLAKIGIMGEQSQNPGAAVAAGNASTDPFKALYAAITEAGGVDAAMQAIKELFGGTAAGAGAGTFAGSQAANDAATQLEGGNVASTTGSNVASTLAGAGAGATVGSILANSGTPAAAGPATSVTTETLPGSSGWGSVSDQTSVTSSPVTTSSLPAAIPAVTVGSILATLGIPDAVEPASSVTTEVLPGSSGWNGTAGTVAGTTAGTLASGGTATGVPAGSVTTDILPGSSGWNGTTEQTGTTGSTVGTGSTSAIPAALAAGTLASALGGTVGGAGAAGSAVGAFGLESGALLSGSTLGATAGGTAGAAAGTAASEVAAAEAGASALGVPASQILSAAAAWAVPVAIILLSMQTRTSPEQLKVLYGSLDTANKANPSMIDANRQVSTPTPYNTNPEDFAALMNTVMGPDWQG